jgi:hypothetical protein
MSKLRVPHDLDADLFADLLESLSDDYYSNDAYIQGGTFEIEAVVEDPTDYSLEVEFHLSSDSDFEEELVRLVDPDDDESDD